MGEVTCGDCDNPATRLVEDCDSDEHAFCDACWTWFRRWIGGFNEPHPSGRYDDE